MKLIDWVMLIALSILWGGSFFFVGVAVAELPPLTIVTLRVAIGASALLVFLAITRQLPKLSRRIVLAFFGMGVLNNVIPFILIVWGQSQIASGLASILNATTPLFTVVVAHFLTRDETLTPLRGFGVLAGIGGVTLMIGPDLLNGLGENVLAQLAILAAAISYAFASIFGRRFKTMGISPMATATGQVCASTLIMIPFMLIIDKPWTLAMPSIGVISAIIGLGLAATSVAYILYFKILANAGATNLSLVTFLIPVSAIFLGIVFLSETLYPRHFMGLAVIGIGLIAIDGRLVRVFSRTN